MHFIYICVCVCVYIYIYIYIYILPHLSVSQQLKTGKNTSSSITQGAEETTWA